MVEFYVNVKPLPSCTPLWEELVFCNLYIRSLRLPLKPVFEMLSHTFLICTYSRIFPLLYFTLIMLRSVSQENF